MKLRRDERWDIWEKALSGSNAQDEYFLSPPQTNKVNYSRFLYNFTHNTTI